MTPTPQTLFVLIGVVVAVGLLWSLAQGAYLSFVEPLLRIRKAKSWCRTPCRILTVRVYSTWHEKHKYSLAILYAYHFDGKEYRSARYGFCPFWKASSPKRAETITKRFPEGIELFCFVNPRAPSEAVLEPGVTSDLLLGLIPVVVLAGFLFMAALAAGLLMDKLRGSWPTLFGAGGVVLAVLAYRTWKRQRDPAYLAGSGRPERLKELLQVSPDLIRTGAAKDALFQALLKSRLDTTQVLLDLSVAPDGRDADGQTPLHYAAEEQDMTFADILISRGAEVNARDGEGMTPLHIAAREGNAPVARLLLAHGADPQATDSEGRTPLAWAKEMEEQEMVKLLRARGI